MMAVILQKGLRQQFGETRIFMSTLVRMVIKECLRVKILDVNFISVALATKKNYAGSPKWRCDDGTGFKCALPKRLIRLNLFVQFLEFDRFYEALWICLIFS